MCITIGKDYLTKVSHHLLPGPTLFELVAIDTFIERKVLTIVYRNTDTDKFAHISLHADMRLIILLLISFTSTKIML